MNKFNLWSYRLAWIYLVLIFVVGLIGPLFTSNAPWKLETSQQTIYPAWQSYLDELGIKNAPESWELKDWKAETGIKTENLIPYDPTYLDLTAVGGKSPSEASNHLLGTDLYGRDVLSGLIEGCRVSLYIGFQSLFFILLFAFLFSILSAYYGNESLKLNALQISSIVILSCILAYYLFVAFNSGRLFILVIKLILFLIVLLAIVYLSKSIFVFPRLKKFKIPLDKLGLKFYELYSSIPSLILLLILIGIQSSKGIFNLSLIFGVLIWPILYRYLRIEFQQEKAKNSYLSYQNMGYNDFRIIFIHLLPNIIKTIINPLIFIFISIIITEATLSFLGLGLEDDIISWGKILAQARQRIDAWWLVLFPGLLLFLTLYSLNIIAKYWQVDKSILK